MRKLFALVLSALLIGSCAMSVGASEAQYPTAGDLYEVWHYDLPDYICGVWSTDGGITNLTFGIQNNEAGNAGKQEILELIENDASVSFVYQQFGRNDLLQMQAEIDEYFQEDLGLLSTGLNEMNNCIVLGIHKERKDDVLTQGMISEITEKYGEAVCVEYTDQPVFTITEEKNPTPWLALTKQPSVLMPLGMLILLMIGVVFAIAIRRKMLLLQTDHGTAASFSPPSSKAVEDMVKKSDCHIPSNLKQKVMSAIEKIQPEK